MVANSFLGRLGLASGWSRELVMAAIALVAGFVLLPVLIYQAGTAALGSYEGASLSRTYDGIFQGLVTGSVASWIVVLGPYGFYLLFKLLRLWWRVSARPA